MCFFISVGLFSSRVSCRENLDFSGCQVVYVVYPLQRNVSASERFRGAVELHLGRVDGGHRVQVRGAERVHDWL